MVIPTTVVDQASTDTLFFWCIAIGVLQGGVIRACLVAREHLPLRASERMKRIGDGAAVGGLVSAGAYLLCVVLLVWILSPAWLALAGDDSGPAWAGVRHDLVALWLFAPAATGIIAVLLTVNFIHWLDGRIAERRRRIMAAFAQPVEDVRRDHGVRHEALHRVR